MVTLADKQPDIISQLPIFEPLRLCMLALSNTFRTYDWLKPYQPIDLSSAYLLQILQSKKASLGPNIC